MESNKLDLSKMMQDLKQRDIEQRRIEEEAARQALERKQEGLQKMLADLGEQIAKRKGGSYVK